MAWSTGGSAKPSPKRAPEDELERMRALYQQHYQGFTIKHFHEKLEQRHGYKLGYTTTRLYLQKTGTVPPAPRRGAHRRKRPRRPMRGMMLHQDGSKHVWLAGRPALDLIITMDDATSEIYSALPGRRGRHAEQPARAGRGDRAPRPVHGALHRPRQPLLLHPRGRRQGLQDPADPGRPGAQAARHRPHPGLFAGGQGPLRARLPDPAGPPAQGAGAGRDHHHRGRQPVPARGLPARAQQDLRRSRPRSRPRPSWWSPRRSGATSSRSRRSASSATTTASPGAAASCRSRPRRCARTWCAPGSGSTTIPTAPSPSSKGPSGWPASRRPRLRRPRTWPRDHRDAASPVDLVDNAARCPQPHRAHNSGQLMRYLLRTKQRARYRSCPGSGSVESEVS